MNVNKHSMSLCCRSYGSVYKALHKESGQVLAIKQVPVDTDLQEIIKEISIMQQCDSPWVVKYYGSYFKNTDLWVSSGSLMISLIIRHCAQPSLTIPLFILLFSSHRNNLDIRLQFRHPIFLFSRKFFLQICLIIYCHEIL